MPLYTNKNTADYYLDEQIGYILRIVSQRHTSIFQKHILFDLTPMQFSALIRLAQLKECSQNELGRQTAMDVATIKGVIDRLIKKGMVTQRKNLQDRRRSVLSVSKKYEAAIAQLHDAGRMVTNETLQPLAENEKKTLIKLLRKLSS